MLKDGSWEWYEDDDGWYCGNCYRHLSNEFEGVADRDGTLHCSDECKTECEKGLDIGVVPTDKGVNNP